MIEVRLVTLRARWGNVKKAEKEMADLFREGFLMLNSTVSGSTIVYVFTRTVTQT